MTRRGKFQGFGAEATCEGGGLECAGVPGEPSVSQKPLIPPLTLPRCDGVFSPALLAESLDGNGEALSLFIPGSVYSGTEYGGGESFDSPSPLAAGKGMVHGIIP